MSENSMNKNIEARHTAHSESIQGTKDASEALDNALTANKMDASQDKLQAEADENSVIGRFIKSEKIARRQELRTEKAIRAQKSVLVSKDEADSLAGEFSQREGNREYYLDPLILRRLAEEELGVGINENSKPDDVIKLLLNKLTVNGQPPDVTVVDKICAFLLEVTESKLKTANEKDRPRLTAIYNNIEAAKNKHYASNEIEIKVAQKIIGAGDVGSAMQATGHSFKETLDNYRNIVHNPPPLQELRKSFEAKGGYKKMIIELKGLSAYLGGNLKRENLENPEIAQLIGAARKMQGIVNVFERSKLGFSRMESYLQLNDVLAPAIK